MTLDAAWARLVQTSFLPDTAKIERKTRASDGAGGFTETWATIAASAACRVTAENSGAALSQVAALLGERETAYRVWRVTMTYGTNVLVGDRVTTRSQALRVAAKPESPFQTAVVLICVAE